MLGHIWTTIPKIARELGIADAGYREIHCLGRDRGVTMAITVPLEHVRPDLPRGAPAPKEAGSAPFRDARAPGSG